MKTPRFSALIGLFALAAAAHAQQVVHIVVPFGAGGVQDIIARSIAPELGQLIGKTVIVENRTGASGTIGNAFVAKSAPDGNTLLREDFTRMGRIVKAAGARIE